MPRRTCFIFLFLVLLIIAPLQAKTILIVGDSLSAGLGLPDQKNWVGMLADKLGTQHKNWSVINLSTSGDTTSNGLAKLPQGLEENKPSIVIIELGANDGLRGLALPEIYSNLAAIIEMSQKAGAKILLLATPLPPNYGQQYLSQFAKVYADLANKYKTIRLIMFLNGVAGNPNLMQADGLHPNMAAQVKILNNIWPTLEETMKATTH